MIAILLANLCHSEHPSRPHPPARLALAATVPSPRLPLEGKKAFPPVLQLHPHSVLPVQSCAQ